MSPVGSSAACVRWWRALDLGPAGCTAVWDRLDEPSLAPLSRGQPITEAFSQATEKYGWHWLSPWWGLLGSHGRCGWSSEWWEVQDHSPMVSVVSLLHIPQRAVPTACPVIVVTLNDTVGDIGLIYIGHFLNKVWRQGDSPVTPSKIQAVAIVLFC